MTLDKASKYKGCKGVVKNLGKHFLKIAEKSAVYRKFLKKLRQAIKNLKASKSANLLALRVYGG